MLAAPWRVTATEIDATLAGTPLPPIAHPVAPSYGCSDFLGEWLIAMDRLLSERHVTSVPDAEWMDLACKAENEALATLAPDAMGRC